MQIKTTTRPSPPGTVSYRTTSPLLGRPYFLLLLIVFFPYVTGQGVFEVKLRRVWNPGGRNMTQQCCTGVEHNGNCLSPCKTYIWACLRQYSPGHQSDCTFGSTFTGELGENSFHGINGNLLKFPIASSWPGSFSLIVEARSKGSDGLISRTEIKRDSFFPREAWSNYTHTGKVANMSVSFRMVCDLNQYGKTCATFCQPRDDQFGHIRCDVNGSHVCLPGWEGLPYCTTPICRQSCGSNGICSGPNTCRCKSGWKGATCDQCETHPGCVHGTCRNAYECNCESEWSGLYCDLERDYCGRNNPCQHGAFCKNTGPGRYRCNCPGGYGGINCEHEINECNSNPCKHGGSCTDLFNNYKCACPTGFSGKQCETNIDDCSENACKNGGTCLDGVNRYSCHCPAGFSGRACEFAVVKSTLRPTEGRHTTEGNRTSGDLGKRGSSFNWEEKKTLILPIVLCSAAVLCLLAGLIIWKTCRKRPGCCWARRSAKHRDSQEPNTRTEVKHIDPVCDGKTLNETDLKHCGAGGTKSRTNPDIIINFVPSHANTKNVNSKRESNNSEEKLKRERREDNEVKEMDEDKAAIAEENRTSLELTDITPQEHLDELFLPNRCFDYGYWQEVEVEI